MEEQEQQLLADILAELKTLNDRYDKELERAHNERTLQATEDSRHAEVLAEEKQAALEEQRKKEEQLKEQEAAALALEQERFEKIEGFFESFSTAEEANQEFFDNAISALEALDPSDQEIVLSDISHKLTALIEQTEVTDSQLEAEEVRYFTDLALIIFLLGFIPCYLAYKGLSKLFDSAFA